MQQFNYQLLETARKLRQKTQKEVAEQTKISQASLSKAERGLQELPKDSMETLSRYYDLPIEFFERARTLTPVGHLYYRKKLTISDKVIDSFTAKIQIFKDIVDKIMDPVELPDFDLVTSVPDENNSPSEIADKIRYQFGIFKGPLPSLTKLLEAHGVIIIKFDFGTEKIDGLTTVTDSNRKIMFINQAMPNDRIRFSLAHELGHLVMHIELPPLDPNSVEEQADQFASELLMPADEMKENFNIQGISFADLAQMKRRWRVSMHALVRRAKDLELINQNTYRNYQIAFSKKRWTKHEPIILPLEQPQLFIESLQLYKDELGYTDEDLMKLMVINGKDYNDWFVKKPKLVSLY